MAFLKPAGTMPSDREQLTRLVTEDRRMSKSKSKSTALQAQYLPRRGTQCAN